jgi:hypothetical protein
LRGANGSQGFGSDNDVRSKLAQQNNPNDAKKSEAVISAGLLRLQKPPDQIRRLLFGELSLVRLTRAG